MEPMAPPADEIVAPLPIEAPQGIYGLSAHPLEKGEVWVQDVEVLGLGAQAGLGQGFDLALGAYGAPWQIEMFTAELGLSRAIGTDVSLRGTVGVATTVLLPSELRPAEAHPLGAAGGGFTWGTRRRFVSASVRVGYGFDTFVGIGEVNGLYAVGRRGALLAGVSDLIAFSMESPGEPWQVWLAGAAWRFEAGRFSLDLGGHLAFGPSVAWGVIPMPTLAVRYGFGPARDGPP